MTDSYVTTGEAARAIGVSTATLTRWVTSGRVTPAEITAGGHYRWDLTALRGQLPARIQPAQPRSRIAVEDIARVVHAANRELQIIQGDPNPSPPWDEAPDYQVREAISGVGEALRGITPEQSHEAWCDRMRGHGWHYGKVKDSAVKTHPCLVPWADLPAEQQQKDILFIAIVRALATLTAD